MFSLAIFLSMSIEDLVRDEGAYLAVAVLLADSVLV
jgi:hypothetical protein